MVSLVFSNTTGRPVYLGSGLVFHENMAIPGPIVPRSVVTPSMVVLQYAALSVIYFLTCGKAGHRFVVMNAGAWEETLGFYRRRDITGVFVLTLVVLQFTGVVFWVVVSQRSSVISSEVAVQVSGVPFDSS